MGQLYSTKKLSSDSFPELTRISLWDREDEREVAMVVRDVTRVADIRVTREILEWASSGRSGWVPQDALQALDVVLKQALNVNTHFENIGRSYFPTRGETLDVGFGKEVWIGTFSSLRPVGWKDAEVLLTLNVDTASKPSTKNLHLTNESAEGKGDSYIQEVLAGGRGKVVNLQGLSLTEEQRKVVSRDLEGLKIRYEMPTLEGGVRKRQYRVLEMRRKSANHEMITIREEKKKPLDLVLVIFPFKAGSLYDKIKQLGDMKFNISTQCCLKNNLFRAEKLNMQVVANLCLKINAKLGGINHVLAKTCRPKILSKPVMIMGADVSHPAPESRKFKPSIVAVTGSVEPKATIYETQVRIQDAGNDKNEEVIQDMKNITVALLKKFYERNNGRKPERLIMFRDGVSEGQFLTVLAKELMAIREACKELEADYEPPITYLVVQKRHHTRFFPADNNKYRNGNALAGTVIDQGINHPTEGDFYLLSHEGIQGTSRPCHYHVLWDDSGFTADELEVLSYYLCHLYSRCTRSVSYPTPTYYAHLVADRARKHHNELAMADNSSCSGNSKGDLSEKEKLDIKKRVEEGICKAMYFV